MAKMYSEIQLGLEIAGYKAQLEKVKAENAKMRDDYKKKVDAMRAKTNSFQNTLKDLGKALASVFAVQQVIQFGKEIINLAANAEGVKNAFNKLDDPLLLNKLRTATRGTVDDVKLMTAAVQANNFRISLEQLPTFFAFASQRARATGESVDYLVESIVKGIGRKSALVLDNLGISLTELNEQLKLTPDYAIAVGAIIEREMKKSGEYVNTTADAVAKMNTQWINTKTLLGEGLINAGVGGTVGILSESMTLLNSAISGSGEAAEEAAPKWWKLKENMAIVLGLVNQAVANKRAIEAMGNNLPGLTITATAPAKRSPLLDVNAPNLQSSFKIPEMEDMPKVLSDLERFAADMKEAELAIDAFNESIIQPITFDKEIAMANELAGLFDNMFRASLEGWDEFGKAALSAIKSIISELVAKAVFLSILYLLTGGTGGIGKFVVSGIKTGLGLKSAPVNLKISGRDMVGSYNRSLTSLNSNT